MVRQFAASARNAFHGIAFVWRQERNFRIQGVITLLLLLFMVHFRFTFTEFVVILFACATVMAAEMLNTIVEEILDVVAPQYSEHVGHLKDVTAGVVLLFSSFSSIVGILTVAHHFVGLR